VPAKVVAVHPRTYFARPVGVKVCDINMEIIMRKLTCAVLLYLLTVQVPAMARSVDSLENFPSTSIGYFNPSGLIASPDGNTVTMLYASFSTDNEVDSAWYLRRYIVRVWDLPRQSMILERCIDTYELGDACLGTGAVLWGDSADLNVAFVNREGYLHSMNIRTGTTKQYNINMRQKVCAYVDASKTIMFWRKLPAYLSDWYAFDLRKGTDITSDFPTGWINLGDRTKPGFEYCVPTDTLGDTVVFEIRRFRDRSLRKVVRARIGCQPNRNMLLRYAYGGIDMTNTQTGQEHHVSYRTPIISAIVSGAGGYVIFVDSTDVLLSWNTSNNAIDTITKNFVNSDTEDSLTLTDRGEYTVGDGKLYFLAYYCRDTVFHYSIAGRRRISATHIPMFRGLSSMGIGASGVLGMGYNVTPGKAVIVCYDTLGNEVPSYPEFHIYLPNEDVPQWVLRVDYAGIITKVSVSDFQTPIVSVPPVMADPWNVQWPVDKDRLIISDVGRYREGHVAQYERKSQKVTSFLSLKLDLGQSIWKMLYPSKWNKVFLFGDSALFYADADSMENLIRLEDFQGARLRFACLSADDEMLAVGDNKGNCYVYTVEPFKKLRMIKLPGNLMSMTMKGVNKESALVVDMNTSQELMVYDASFDSLLYGKSVGFENAVIRFSPTGRYLLMAEDIIDTKTWRSVYLNGGDYDVPAEFGAFLYNDSIFARSTKDFGVYMLDIQNNDRSSYKTVGGKVYLNEKRGTAYSIDTANNVHYMSTSDWKERSLFTIPNGVSFSEYVRQDVYIPGSFTLNPNADAIALRNSIGTLYIWYPLTSSITSIDNNTFRDTSGVSSYAIGIPCRNGISQLALQAAPDPGSMRVIDVLGREVAWSIENSTVRLSQCHAGYHLVTYRHAGRTQSIPVMVVEE
jgi:hypothetical protein